FFFFSSRRRHTRSKRDWSSDVCSSDLNERQATHGGSGLAAPATTSPARTSSRPPTAVPGSRRPLQRSTIRRRRRAWPIGPGWEEIGRASCRERGQGGGGEV